VLLLKTQVVANESPTLLHVSREARKIALKSYTLILEGRFKHPVYFDFSRDTLCLTTPGRITECIFESLTDGVELWTYSAAPSIRFVVPVSSESRGSQAGPTPPPNIVERNIQHLAIRVYNNQLTLLGRFQSLTTLTICYVNYRDHEIYGTTWLEGRKGDAARQAIAEAINHADAHQSLPRRPGVPSLPQMTSCLVQSGKRHTAKPRCDHDGECGIGKAGRLGFLRECDGRLRSKQP
jgi:hypothetical protein